MNHYKLTPIQWNSGLKLKAGMVVIFENGYYQSLKGKNSGEPKNNNDFVYIGEVDRFGSVAKINASNILGPYVDNWLDALNIYTIPEVDELLSKKADLVGGVVPANQLPSYVDDVIEGYYQDGDFYQDSNLTQPISGEAGKLYLDLFKSETYRWTGSIFLKVGGSALKLGIADQKDGVNGYQIINENVSLLGFFTSDFDYSYIEDPQNPGLNIPTISLKTKPIQATLTDNKIPVWNQTAGKLVDSEIYETTDKKIGIGKTNPTQKVDIEGNIKANALISKTYTVAERNAIPNPVEGMIIYQNEIPKGFYKYENSAWTQIGANISNSDLTNTSARTFTQANAFTWNTAGQFYYLKGLLDKTGNAAYMKSVMVHATTGEKVTRDADDPVVVTSAINKATASQKTSMRTALLGTATPASPTISGANPSLITKGVDTYVDLYGLNLTLLNPSFIYIQRSDGTKINALQFYNVTTTTVRSLWNLPTDLPDGVYQIYIQNGVTAQGASQGYFYVSSNQLTQVNILSESWVKKLEPKSDGSPATQNSFGDSYNTINDNYIRLGNSTTDGLNSQVAIKSSNILPTGINDIWSIEANIMYSGGGTGSDNSSFPFIGVTKTNDLDFNKPSDISLLENSFGLLGTGAMGYYFNQSNRLHYSSTTIPLKLIIEKPIGNKIYMKYLFDTGSSQVLIYNNSVNITIDSNYSIFMNMRSGQYGGMYWSSYFNVKKLI